MFRSSTDVVIPRSLESVNSNTDVFVCGYCSDEYCSESEVEVHRKLQHYSEIAQLISEDKVVCKICAAKLTTKSELLKHIKNYHLLSSEDSQHVDYQIFVCDYCDNLFFNKFLLLTHILRRHQRNSKSIKFIKCMKCNKVVKVRTIWFHFIHDNILSVACCPICMLKCKHRKDMLEHISKSHSKLYKCSRCGYETSNESVFKEHVASHSRLDIQQIPFKEGISHKYFIPKFNCMSWKSSDDAFGLRGLLLPDVSICILCRRICVGESEMSHHINYDHRPVAVAEKKKYACSCGEDFFNNVLLKHHIFKLQGDHKSIVDQESPSLPTETS